ncbi:MAG: FadR family transcriptional regulator [Rhodospirillaceae bacterium]|nr:FadR family transcriptional regulator [Rhodospirillaceae bacterium]
MGRIGTPVRGSGKARAHRPDTMQDGAANADAAALPVDANRGSVWIAGQLRQAIIAGTYRHGEKLPAERHLADAFNASRTTVRLALDQLEQERLVTRRVGSGTFVNHRAVSELDNIADSTSPLELIEARLGIEPHMTRLAVLNASNRDIEKMTEVIERAELASDDSTVWTDWDTQFHLLLAEAAHNRLILWLYQHINEIRSHDQWASMRDKVLTPARIAEYNRQHRALLGAIASRDVEGAAAMVTSHLHFARRQLMGIEDA